MRLKLIMHCLMLVQIAVPAGTADETRRWPIEISAGRFQIHSDFRTLDPTRLIEELQQLSGEMTQLLDLPQSQEAVHVVLFENQSEYRRYMRNYFPELPERRALFIQHRGPGMLFTHWHEHVATDVRHEGAHALLNADTGPLPLWLDEGLAEYFEVQSGDRFRGSDYVTEVSQLVAQGWMPPLDALEAIADLEHFQNVHYRDSWAWVHFLLHRRNDTRQLLIRTLRDHRSQTALPLSRQLTQLMPEVELEFKSHFQQLTP